MRVKTVIMLMVPLAAALGVSAGPARAAGASGPCRQDVQKFCPDAKRGPALRDCLKQHASELSPACQEHLKQAKAKVQKWQQACQDDVQKFCASVPTGGGNILKCLHQHQDELSKSCQDQMAQHRHHAGAAKQGTQPNPQ